MPPWKRNRGVFSISASASSSAWRDRILAAQGDDDSLLELARTAPSIELQLSAVSALREEDALKRAMREFRDRDKRLHRAARSRWQEAVDRRESAAEAARLIEGARGLIGQEAVPVNRLVELDRAWSALRIDLLDEALVAEFQSVRAELGTQVRSHGDSEQALARWLPAVDAAIEALLASLAEVARGGTAPATPAPLADALLNLRDQVPAEAADARALGKLDAAHRALALGESIVQRARFIESLPAPGEADENEEKARIDQWRGFPEVADSALQELLASRFSEWRNANAALRQREHDARRAQEREQSAEQRKRRLAQIRRQVESAEAAHAAGQLAELTRLVAAIDGALEAGPVEPALVRRIEFLRHEQLRLREWQRWSGAQQREALVAEAQALAKAAEGKIATKAHAEAIDKLRARWKEVDKLGGATSKSLWTAFDGALKAAYAPVAAHLEMLKAQRAENLASRNKLIESLSQAKPGPDWRALARTLEEAKAAWRKLGPVEHTVPREAQKGEQAVSARFTAALHALEAPLAQVRRDAAQERERLIAAAKSLTESTPLRRDAVDQVRALQTQWQAHAKSLPLLRGEENALWTRFKAATDAVFTARDAARAAREAEANAPIKAREAILETLAALPSTVPEIKRALAAADTAWRSSPRIHGPQAAKLESRFRSAREAASKRLRELADHAAQAKYDALLAAIRLCDERETAGETGAGLESRWTVLDLPAPWKSALEPRWRGTSTAKPEALPDTLLQLEVALNLESPPEFVAARQRLKLLALKTAMEDRRTGGSTPADIERWLLAAASIPSPDGTSRARLEKIISAVRARAP
jgi:hypothetical protein